jgi:hypothetical protein
MGVWGRNWLPQRSFFYSLYRIVRRTMQNAVLHTVLYTKAGLTSARHNFKFPTGPVTEFVTTKTLARVFSLHSAASFASRVKFDRNFPLLCA